MNKTYFFVIFIVFFKYFLFIKSMKLIINFISCKKIEKND